MTHFPRLLIVIFIFTIQINFSFGLECYVCDNQEDNEGKCVTTISTCQPEEDVCLTEVKWGSRPYWVPGAQKQFYISKRCANNQKCKRQRDTYMQYCSHIWYEDWKCSECCKGDKCNYYIISAAHDKQVSVILLVSSIFVIFSVLAS
ncbi:hypothetical protein QE152_g9527 [Popillia japonica]|uniref:Snake toxin/toxin-like domain-containing protein n=1 Tax=Popillia japonica TaxID=7064 RepID=A0AAW1LUC7_POPJA